MIGYKDTTFCPFWADCANGPSCPRALTDAVKAGAVAWWGGPDAPIAMYGSEPRCFVGVEDTTGDLFKE